MGNQTSSHAAKDKTSSGKKLSSSASVRGRKSPIAISKQLHNQGVTAEVEIVHEEHTHSTHHADDLSVHDESSDEETSYESEEEEDEEWEERLRILEDAKALKNFAKFFLHPEVPVVSSEACARCYFDRPSAPEPVSVEDANEQAQILSDLQALKKLAVDFLHPEIPVVTTDATACGRNYFTRASAPEQESLEDTEERARVLEDAVQLKKLAVDYMHPEKPVVTSDPTVFGRNYFSRASAPEQESFEEAEERARVLEEVKQLKKLAVDYLHPELPLVSTDSTACARNFFTRASAPEYESAEDIEERIRVLEDARQLKKLAVDFMHPEAPVVMTDPTLFGRNYFARASAPEQESFEDAEERARILEDAMQLKKLAVDYMHPEKPVVTSDPTVFGRNYFSRASAPDQESYEEAEERARVLEEAKQLKKLAVDYLHPELPLVTTDSTACARNFFTRASVPEYESAEDMEERIRVLEDAKQLKKLAVDFMHPEAPVVMTDPTLFGRNYFARASAPEQESFEEAEERARILEDAVQLKKLAVDYMHPEKPVVTSDPTVFGRNYFSRASAPDQESYEEAEERALILKDCRALTKLAIDYQHPELPVATSDAAACARNYFSRASASGHAHMIHSFPPHDHDEHDHHEHIDHFGMDEDLELEMFANEMRQKLPGSGGLASAKAGGKDSEEEESNLSRSPSSVMLYMGEPIYD